MKEKKPISKNQKQVRTVDVPRKTGSTVKPQKSVSGLPDSFITRSLIVAAILIVTFIAFFPSLQNGMLKTWDDQEYVTNNKLVRSLSVDNIKVIFKDDRGLCANYHPLTTLSLAVNYHFSKAEPFGYHLTNLLLHLLNTLLVFIFIYLLTKKNLEIAAVTSLFFGLAPVHVESVAWISERKDVLYAFFFLVSLIAYLQFLKKSDWKLYGLSLLLFLCSMLSKAMAASLPLVLILIGFMVQRRWSLKMFVDKLPYIIIAIILGLYAIRIQSESKALGEIIFPLTQRILHACYGFAGYIMKTFLPFEMGAYYPYPYPLINSSWVINTMPSVFYLTLIFTCAVIGFSVYCLLSGKKNLVFLGFGILFYAATVALVLQFLPVGRAIMADRYAYIPSIGLFFIAGYFLDILYRKKPFKVPVIIVVGVYAGFLFFMTREQTRIWKNDEILWSNVVRQYPMDSRIVLVYANRAQFYRKEGRLSDELNDLLTIAQYNQNDDNTLDRIGKIYGKEMNDIETSLKYFQQAYQANPKNLDVINDLTTVYGLKGDYKKSVEYAGIGLGINKDDASLLYKIGCSYCNLGQLDLGKGYIAKALLLDPDVKNR